MKDVRLKLLPPWSIYIKKIEALFDGDPQIACNVDYSGAAPSIILACNNGDKVAALQRILPDEIVFGGIKLKIGVDGVPSNRAFTSKVELFDTAFKGNPAYAYSTCPAEEGSRPAECHLPVVWVYAHGDGEGRYRKIRNETGQRG